MMRLTNDEARNSIEASLEHAVFRADQLSDLITDWRAAASIGWSPRIETRRFRAIATAVPQPPIQFAILAAEAIHPVPAALDHIIWHLAPSSLRSDERRARRLYFPIVTNEAYWPPQNLEWLSSGQLSAIEHVQPFRAVRDGETTFQAKDHAFATARAINDNAKHRTNYLAGTKVRDPMKIDEKTVYPPGVSRFDVHHSPTKKYPVAGDALVDLSHPPGHFDWRLSVPSLDVTFRVRDDFAIHHEQLGRLVRDCRGLIRQLMDGLF